MRFLADENISPTIATALEALGHDVVAVGVAMPSAVDEAIIERAIAEDRILVTEDKDFGELAFKHKVRPPGIIRLALPSLSPSEKATRFRTVLEQPGVKVAGHALVIEPRRVRARPIS